MDLKGSIISPPRALSYHPSCLLYNCARACEKWESSKEVMAPLLNLLSLGINPQPMGTYTCTWRPKWHMTMVLIENIGTILVASSS